MSSTVLVMILLPLAVGVGTLLGLLVLTRVMPGDPAMAKKGAAAVAAKAPAVPARGPQYEALTAKRKAGFRTGVMVLGLLGVLTVLEFFAAALGSTILMFLFMLAKGAAILYYFMHVTSVWRTEEAH
ncbi:MAG: hypothetical protein NZ528_16805 [Caldilineales bacterium]|nr:hypothetical protein [Caldilineales bacterium]MDW8317304.1 hypothetical protein [Anaerolineae bacterium]